MLIVMYLKHNTTAEKTETDSLSSERKAVELIFRETGQIKMRTVIKYNKLNMRLC